MVDDVRTPDKATAQYRELVQRLNTYPLKSILILARRYATTKGAEQVVTHRGDGVAALTSIYVGGVLRHRSDLIPTEMIEQGEMARAYFLLRDATDKLLEQHPGVRVKHK